VRWGLSGPSLVRGWYGQPFDPPPGRTRDYLAIVLGAEGPKNVALAREIADGWIATDYSLALGAGRPGARRAAGDFEVIGTVPVVLGDDTEAAADHLRPVFAAFIGPPGKIREELPAWRDSLLTTLVVYAPLRAQILGQVAELILG
jgi:alkanesulfonate monooxygenase SsuD/methylene tetrahydromethanopterin reductase-like flavin-dependent oxidoreductase (luciferase family)